MEESSRRLDRSRLATILLGGMVVMLVVAGLLLPPISLGRRLLRSDFVRVSTDNPRVDHPDGLELAIDPVLLHESEHVKLESIPRADFAAGSVPDDWQAAAGALPTYLSLKSPVYGITFREEPAPAVRLEIAIPNDAEPYRLLDLYAWDGAIWHWVPSQLDVSVDKITAELARAPKAVGVMQAGALAPSVGMSAQPGDKLPPETSGLVSELHLAGLSLGASGVLAGQVAAFGGESASYRQFPTSVATDPSLLQALLSEPAAQQAHLSALTNLAVEGGYAGLNLDYRGVTTPQRAAFTTFVGELAARLRAAGLEFMVTVPAPFPAQAASGDWDTAGYDWPALAAAADRLLISLPLDPVSYSEDGPVDRLLSWAVRQVNRYQILVRINAIGVQEVNAVYTPIDSAEALAPLSTSLARVDEGGSDLEPGSEVVVELPAGFLVEDQAAAAYRIVYDLDGQQAIAWLPSSGAFAQRLRSLTDYHLGGVVVSGLVGSEMVGELAVTLDTFLAAAAPPVAQPPFVTWTVQNVSGEKLSHTASDLSNPRFEWQAVSTPGVYVIDGQLAIGNQVADLGAVQVAVAEARAVAPTSSPEPTPQATATPTATPAQVAEGDTTGSEAPPVDADAVIARELVNVREGPDTAFRRIAQLAQGTPLDILAVNPTSTWIRISAADGTQGWVYASLCTIHISLADTPVEEVPTPTPAPTSTPAPTPEGGSVPPPAPPPAPSGGFELGGQVNGYASRPDAMQQARMTWVKLQAHQGQDASGMISGAHGQGFKILLSVIGDKGQVMNDGYQQQYAAYLGQLAAQGADAIEVWNEANLDREWPRDQIDTAAYTRLLAYSYNAIKAAHPGTIVIGGAPAPTGAEGAFPGQVVNDNKWLQGVVNAGGLNYMDCVGIHYNEGTVSPYAWSGSIQGDDYYTRYYGGMVNTYWSITGGARPLCFTELGYLSPEGYGALPGNFGWAGNTTVAQQAQWLGEVVGIARASGQVRLMIIFNVDFTQWLPTDPQAGYAIIRPGGGCPACATMGAAMGG